MSRIISFKGQLASGGQDTINLHTNNGLLGYKIKTLHIITKNPMSGTTEAVVKAYSVKQSTIDAVVDFSQQTLLAVGIMVTTEAQDMVIVDNNIFNQDIYITYSPQAGADATNYYIELEQMDLNMDEATVATLKSIRNND